MNLPASAPPWQPLTFGGVAAFAAGSFGRLCRVQMLVALLTTVCLLWFLVTGIMPAIERAIPKLPEQASIQQHRLRWPDQLPVVLTSSPFLAVKVDPIAALPAGTGADLELVLGPDRWRVECLLGRFQAPYPDGWQLILDRSAVDAWWGARQTPLLASACLFMFVFLLLTWWLLAFLYTAPVRSLAILAHRQLSLGGAWRLANAALLPGTLLVSVALLLYSLHHLPLPGLILACLLHLPVGWLYAAFAPFRLPRSETTTGPGPNPFNPGSPSRAKDRARTNPFANPHPPRR